MDRFDNAKRLWLEFNEYHKWRPGEIRRVDDPPHFEGAIFVRPDESGVTLTDHAISELTDEELVFAFCFASYWNDDYPFEHIDDFVEGTDPLIFTLAKSLGKYAQMRFTSIDGVSIEERGAIDRAVITMHALGYDAMASISYFLKIQNFASHSRRRVATLENSPRARYVKKKASEF